MASLLNIIPARLEDHEHFLNLLRLRTPVRSSFRSPKLDELPILANLVLSVTQARRKYNYCVRRLIQRSVVSPYQASASKVG
jgi:hypothetical protein